MADTYRIVLTGNALPQANPGDAARSLAALLRLTEAGAANLLTGRETIVKRGLPGEQIDRYVAAIEKAGAAVRVVPESAPVGAAAVPAVPSVSAAPAAPVSVTVAPVAPLSAAVPLALVEETMKCPACGAEQPKRTLCRECGVDMPRMLAAQEEARRAPPPPPQASPYAAPRSQVRDALPSGEESETPAAMSFSFQGRIGRVRYLAYGLPAYLPMLVAALIGGGLMALTRNPAAMFVPLGLAGLVTLWLALRVLVLRLHDLNRSGWTALVFLLPVPVAVTGSPVAIMAAFVIIGLMALALTFWPGADEANDYGPPAGPNTLWTVVGAVAVIALSVAGSLSGGGRFASGQPFDTPPAAAEE
jgi:uncharacterized membrane protein YhaH (DUF805 family)